MNVITEICKTFNRSAADYDKAANVQYEIGERLIERLNYLKITPRYVLDLGCGTGVFTQQLQEKYPNAEIIGLDLAYAMLLQAKNKQNIQQQYPLINANMLALPFANGIFDLVFANQVIHWSISLPNVIREVNRVMNEQGCLMFSTLGPDTFKELKGAWAVADTYEHTNQFMDMHHIGDCLLAEHFLDPVVDMEWLTIHYTDLSKLLKRLKKQGVKNINPARNKGLTGKQAWQTFVTEYLCYCTDSGKYPLTYEVIYGHAWKGKQHRVGSFVETFIPVSSIIR